VSWNHREPTPAKPSPAPGLLPRTRSAVVPGRRGRSGPRCRRAPTRRRPGCPVAACAASSAGLQGRGACDCVRAFGVGETPQCYSVRRERDPSPRSAFSRSGAIHGALQVFIARLRRRRAIDRCRSLRPAGAPRRDARDDARFRRDPVQETAGSGRLSHPDRALRGSAVPSAYSAGREKVSDRGRRAHGSMGCSRWQRASSPRRMAS